MGALENFYTRVLPGRGNGAAANEPAPAEEASQEAPPANAWGLSAEHLTAAYDANEIYFGERAQELDYRGSFFYCRQHDQKPFDMNGLPLSAAPTARPFPGSQKFLASTGDPRFVPIAMRRPNAPYRLSRVIVKAFTGMLLGQNRWPQIRSDDPDTQAFCEAVIKAANVRNRFTRARNIAGACGTAGLSWLFRNGRPVVRVHNGRFIQTLEWEDPDELVPCHVTELYRSTATRATKDGPQRYEVWCRRDWTKVADVVFKPVEVTPDNPIEWIVDEERSYPHDDGECHFVWLTNQPDDEDPTAVDGQPDYAETYEQLDVIDGSNSIFVQGVARNLDPTLHVKRENPEDIKTIRKGSDNAIVTGPNGDVKYVTIPGDVVETGEKLVNMQRGQVLETAQCVVTDPDKAAAAGTSSLTMKLVYAPMIGATDLIREPFGAGLVRLLEQMQRSAARVMGPREGDSGATEPEQSPDGSQQFENAELPPDEQEPERVNFYLTLPPRVVTEPVLDETGKPTGEVTKKSIEQHPGAGKIELEWGDYFPPTSDDKQKNITTLATAAGGKSVISQQTAVETTAAILNKDATDEWQRVNDEASRQRFDAGNAGGSDIVIDEPTVTPDPATDEHRPTTPMPPHDELPEDIQKTALNGAQVASIVDVVVQVAKGDLPRESGVEILAVALNISHDEASQIMGEAGIEAEPEGGPGIG